MFRAARCTLFLHDIHVIDHCREFCQIPWKGIISIAPGVNPGFRVSPKKKALHAPLVDRTRRVLQRNIHRLIYPERKNNFVVLRSGFHCKWNIRSTDLKIFTFGIGQYLFFEAHFYFFPLQIRVFQQNRPIRKVNIIKVNQTFQNMHITLLFVFFLVVC